MNRAASRNDSPVHDPVDQELDFFSSTNKDAKSWYAVRVREKFRLYTEELFQAQGIACFSPKLLETHQWSDRRKLLLVPLFSGYVFCQFDPASQLTILRTLGVIEIVRSGTSLCQVDSRELEAIQRALRSQQPIESIPSLVTGRRVRVKSGPLESLEGILLESSSDVRLVLGVTMVNRSIAVQVERANVQAI